MGEEKLENSRAERRKAHKMQMSSSSKRFNSNSTATTQFQNGYIHSEKQMKSHFEDV